jgi:MFS transporter, UMF1 family
MFANVGFGASIVAMNSYLPMLSKEAPEVQEIEDKLNQLRRDGPVANDLEEHASLLPQGETSSKALQAEYDKTLSTTTSRISSQGIASGYVAGIALLMVALVPVRLLQGSTWSLRLAIGLSGIWWAIGTIPAAILLPGAQAMNQTEWAEATPNREWKMSREIVGAWIRLGNMLRWSEIKKLKNTFRYLAAWFLLSDGVCLFVPSSLQQLTSVATGFTTITSTALLFAKTSLSMPPSSLILIGILTPVSGIIGSLIWPRIQRSVGWSNLRVLTILIVTASLIPAYGCLGFLFEGNVEETSGVRIKFGGLTTPGEMYALAVVFGSVYGAFQGYARAFYAELIPPGEEARWYGLFSITDKVS